MEPSLTDVDTVGRDVQSFVLTGLSADELNGRLQAKLKSLRGDGYDVVHKVEFTPPQGADIQFVAHLIVSGSPAVISNIAAMREFRAVRDGSWLSHKTSNTGRFFDAPPGVKPSVIRGSPNEIIARVMNAIEGKVEPGSFVPLVTLAEWTELPAGRIRAALACYPTVNGDRVVDVPPRFLMTGDPEDESSLGYALNPEWVRYSTPQKRGGIK